MRPRAVFGKHWRTGSAMRFWRGVGGWSRGTGGGGVWRVGGAVEARELGPVTVAVHLQADDQVGGLGPLRRFVGA